MSRSCKKAPMRGIAVASSEKDDERFAYHLEQQINKQIPRTTRNNTQRKAEKEISDPWGWNKDGKVRFDPATEPQSLRK